MSRRAFIAAAAATLAAAASAAAQTAQPAPRVVLTTTLGEIEITLDPTGAPLTSAHMLRLFRSRHYIGAAIFRIEPGHLIQLGDLDANLNYRQPPGGTVPLETATNRHGRRTVSLARDTAPNSGHSSFYFDLAPNTHLNAEPGAAPNTTGYATFGRVTRGWEVVEAMARVPLHPTRGPFPGALPVDPIVITAIRIE